MEFLKSIPQSFVYPFRGQGKIILVISLVLSIMWGFTQWATPLMLAGWLAGLMLLGYLMAYNVKVLKATSEGKEEMPDFPEFLEIKQNILDPAGRYFFVLLICFCVPSYILLFKEGVPALRYVAWIWGIAGFVFFPMVLIRVAVMDSIEGINPVGIIKTILRVPFPYIGLLIIVYGIMIFAPVVTCFIFISYFGLFILVGLMFLELYFFFVLMNILGNFYLVYEDAFGWTE